MQTLRILVIIMGALILAGIAVIGTEIYKRITDPERRAATERALHPQPQAPVTLPVGARIGEMVSAGNHVIFRVSLPEEGERLYLLDPRTAAAIPLVLAVPAPAVPVR